MSKQLSHKVIRVPDGFSAMLNMFGPEDVMRLLEPKDNAPKKERDAWVKIRRDVEENRLHKFILTLTDHRGMNEAAQNRESPLISEEELSQWDVQMTELALDMCRKRQQAKPIICASPILLT